MLQRVDQGIGSGSVSEWGPASSGVVRSAPVHTTAGIPALVILQYCHPKSCAVFLCCACANYESFRCYVKTAGNQTLQQIGTDNVLFCLFGHVLVLLGCLSSLSEFRHVQSGKESRTFVNACNTCLTTMTQTVTINAVVSFVMTLRRRNHKIAKCQ